MKIAAIALSVICFLIGPENGSLSGAECKPVPEVVVKEASWVRTKGVHLKWRILNTADVPIYIYSTFLTGSRAAAWSERSDGTVEIRTSLNNKLHMTAYSYPKAVFTRIEPHSALDGNLSDPAQQLKKLTKVRISLSVAYGNSIAKVQQDLQQSAHVEAEHPANPIVGWQCIAWSNVVDLKVDTH
jgi:hypothetical protein